MVKHTQAIRRLLPTICLSVFDHVVWSALEWLVKKQNSIHEIRSNTVILQVGVFILTYVAYIFTPSQPKAGNNRRRIKKLVEKLNLRCLIRLEYASEKVPRLTGNC